MGSPLSDIDECAVQSHYCQANTVCVNVPGSHRCDCLPAFIRVDDYSCTGRSNMHTRILEHVGRPTQAHTHIATQTLPVFPYHLVPNFLRIIGHFDISRLASIVSGKQSALTSHGLSVCFNLSFVQNYRTGVVQCFSEKEC